MEYPPFRHGNYEKSKQVQRVSRLCSEQECLKLQYVTEGLVLENRREGEGTVLGGHSENHVTAAQNVKYSRKPNTEKNHSPLPKSPHQDFWTFFFALGSSSKINNLHV